MSLMKTLAKVAVGVALAKGASSMMNKSGGAQAGGLGGLLGALQGGSGQAAGGGLQSMMGGLLGGGTAGGALSQGGLGGLLESLGGASQQSGGLQSMLSGLAGAGGAGALLSGLTGALGQNSAEPQDSFGAVLNSQFNETPEPALAPSEDQEAAAALMLRAMIQATKADGQMDADEEARLIEHLGGDVDAQEAEFVRAEMARPMDVDGLVADTPAALAPQVYAMSVLGIDLDSQAEAQYLHALAQGFGMDASAVNDIHAQLGVPALYS